MKKVKWDKVIDGETIVTIIKMIVEGIRKRRAEKGIRTYKRAERKQVKREFRELRRQRRKNK